MKKQQVKRMRGRPVRGIRLKKAAMPGLPVLGEIDAAERIKVRADVRYLRDQIKERKRQLDEATNLADARQGSIRELEARLHKHIHQLSSIESSLGWRLLKPLNKAHQLINGFLGRVEATPLPHHQITAHDHAWESWGQDPQCLLQGVEYALRQGWYFIEIGIRTECVFADAKFYFDFGEGYNEQDSVFVPYRNGAVAKRLYWLRGRPKSVRMDPMEAACEFSIDSVRFVRASSMFARKRMLVRLARQHMLFQGLAEGEIRRRLVVEAREHGERFEDRLYRRYGETFTLSHQQRQTYGEWLVLHDWPEYADPGMLRKEVEGFARRPVFSVVMAIDGARPALLLKTVDSLLRQSYPEWELLVVQRRGDAEIAGLVESHGRQDPRLRILHPVTGESLAAAANRCLAEARGDYCFLLDPEDALSPYALHSLAKELNARPACRIVYSDEDRIDEDDQRFDPYFKPDWSPDELLSHDYVSRLVAYAVALVREVGGLREGFAEGEGYDLLLRCAERTRADEIGHVHKVLYHRRIRREPPSVTEARRVKAQEAGLRSLRDHAARTGQSFSVEKGSRPEIFRIRRPVPSPEPLVSLLIPTRDGLHVLKKCVDSILDKTTYRNYEIIIIDNQSQKPETLAWFGDIARNPRVRIVAYDHPFNYSAINNFGATHAHGSILGLINNDVEVISPEWLTEMVSHVIRPEIGCVGAKLYYTDGTIQHGGVITGIGGVAGHVYRHFPGDHPGYFHRLLVTHDLSVVTAACLLVRREVFEQVGGLNAVDLMVALNDVDFCLRVRTEGYRNLWTPFAELYHHESVSRGADDTPEKKRRFEQEFAYMRRRWSRELPVDPAYNRNLSLTLEDYSLRR